MYMADANNLHLGPNTTYIPLTCVGGFALGDANFRFGVGCFRVFRYQHVGIFCIGKRKILASGALPNTKPRRQVFCVLVEYRLKSSQQCIHFKLTICLCLMLPGHPRISNILIPRIGTLVRGGQTICLCLLSKSLSFLFLSTFIYAG